MTRKLKHNKSTIHKQQLQIQSLQVKNKITKVLIQNSHNSKTRLNLKSITNYKFITRKIKHNKFTIHKQQLQIQSHQVKNKIREATISSATHIIYIKILYSKQNKIREAFNFNTQATISSSTHITYIKIQTFKVSQSTQ